MTRGDGFGFGHSDDGDFGVGEDRSGNHSMIDGVRRIVRQRVLSGDSALPTANRRGHLTAMLSSDDVASGEQVRHGRPQVAVHDDFATVVELRPSPLNLDMVRVGTPAGDHQQPLRSEFPLLSGDSGCDDGLRAGQARGHGRRVEHHGDAFRREYLSNAAPHFSFVSVPEQLSASFEDRDPTAQSTEHLAELECDVAASDDHQ